MEKFLRVSDYLILFCFCVLVIVLPIAHTETIRAFSFGIPLGLWIIKMILQKQWIWRRTPLDIPILLFTIVGGLSLITAVDIRYSFEEYTGEWLTGIVLFYLVVNQFRQEQLPYLLAALLFGNVLMVVYGTYDFFQRGGSLLDYQIRAGSLHYIAGALATYLVTVLPYLLLAVFVFSDWAPRVLLLFLVFLNFFTLYLTHVRGAWLAAIILVFLVGWKFLPKKIILLPAVAVLMGLLVFTPGQVLKHYTKLTNPGAKEPQIETVAARWELLKFSAERISENPFQMIGFGRRSFVKKYEEFYLKYKGALLWHAHNTFINLALQTGVQGLVLFLFIVYILLKSLYRRAEVEEEPLPKGFLLATFFMVVSFFLRNMADDFFVDDAALLFWMLSGTAIATRRG
jgi:O-antigen ligase